MQKMQEQILQLLKKLQQQNEMSVIFITHNLAVAAQIADYKKKNGLPILVPAREREKLQDVAQKAGEDMAN